MSTSPGKPKPEPYLILASRDSIHRSFAYYADQKGLVTVRCVDRGLLGPLGPWLKRTADRHAAGLIQAGFLAFVPSAAMAQTIVESSLAVLDAAPGRSARAA